MEIRTSDPERAVFPTLVGVFLEASMDTGGFVVFPTLVGVFLVSAGGVEESNGLPHARGGVSLSPRSKLHQKASSPRSWGCFQMSLSSGIRSFVFPTLVGVFLLEWSSELHLHGLPHARGGVSRAAHHAG